MKTNNVFITPDHGHLLVSRISGVITCEDYCKWYDLYYIDGDTGIRKLSEYLPESLDELEYLDHTWKPSSVIEFAIKHNLKIGRASYEAIVCRWAENKEWKYGYYQIPDNELPKFSDAIQCIVEDHGIISDFDISQYYPFIKHFYLFDDSQDLNDICFRGEYPFYVTQTCRSDPEQYDAFDIEGYTVGYVRCRYGVLSVECPTTYAFTSPFGIEMTTTGWGLIDDSEKDFVYNIISSTIRKYIKDEDELDIMVGEIFESKFSDKLRKFQVEKIFKNEKGVKAVMFTDDTTMLAMDFHKIEGRCMISKVTHRIKKLSAFQTKKPTEIEIKSPIKLIDVNSIVKDFDYSKEIMASRMPVINYSSILKFKNYEELKNSKNVCKDYYISKIIVYDNMYMITICPGFDFDGDIFDATK